MSRKTDFVPEIVHMGAWTNISGHFQARQEFRGEKRHVLRMRRVLDKAGHLKMVIRALKILVEGDGISIRSSPFKVDDAAWLNRLDFSRK